jgi:hypothetical protein
MYIKMQELLKILELLETDKPEFVSITARLDCLHVSYGVGHNTRRAISIYDKHMKKESSYETVTTEELK